MRTITTLFLLLTLSASSYARKPAVEDFVGVDSESYQQEVLAETNKPTESKITTQVTYNFGNHIQALKSSSPIVSSESISGWFGVASLFAFLALPVLMWFGITKNVKEEIVKVNDLQFEEEATHHEEEIIDDNVVAHLEDYKKEVPEKSKKAS